MDIRTLSFSEQEMLMEALKRAMWGDRKFRISQDSSGIKWKVGEGMWSPSYGKNENAEPNDGETFIVKGQRVNSYNSAKATYYGTDNV